MSKAHSLGEQDHIVQYLVHIQSTRQPRYIIEVLLLGILLS